MPWNQIFYLLIFVLVPPLMAVQAVSTLDGTVVDPSGAAVAEAEVLLYNPVSGFQRGSVPQEAFLTDGQGRFRFSNIPFQGYEVRIERSGFQVGWLPPLSLPVG